MSGTKTIVAVVDDESNMRSALQRLLRTHGYEVQLFATGDAFLEAADPHGADCLLLDLYMPQTTGFAVLRAMASRHLGVPAIVITGHDEPGNAERVHELGAVNYLLKPLDETLLVKAIEEACPDPTLPQELPD